MVKQASRRWFNALFSATGLPAEWTVGMVIGAIFLAGQLVRVAGCQFEEARFFCWSPHTTQVAYSIQVEIDGVALTPDEIAGRYGIPAEDWEAHSYYNLIVMLRQYESTRGQQDNAHVVLEYSVNGRPAEKWEWPES